VTAGIAVLIRLSDTVLVRVMGVPPRAAWAA